MCNIVRLKRMPDFSFGTNFFPHVVQQQKATTVALGPGNKYRAIKKMKCYLK